MRTITRIPGIFRSDASEEVFDDLARIYPEGLQGQTFSFALPADDPRTVQIVERLNRAGLRPWTDTFRERQKGIEYAVQLDREYDAADLAACDFLELRPPPEACNYGAISRGESGDVIIPEQQMPSGKPDFLFGHTYWYFVPARVKDVLSMGNLKGVKFRPTYYAPLDMTAEDTDATIRSRHGIPYWELDSDRTLPPLSPSMSLVDARGNASSPGVAGPCRPYDGLYIRPELHYRADDLAKTGQFDLARAHERFNAFGGPGDRPLIASRRFFEFCNERCLRTGWVPVRVDPD